MFCKVNSTTKAGLAHNEDAFFSNENTIVVIDGASSLGGVHLTDAPTDACWLAKTTATLLSEKMADGNRPIPLILEETAEELRRSLYACGYGENAENFPSCSLMAARLDEEQLELFSLGDCTALVRFHDGRPLLCFHDDAVTKLDNSVLEKAGIMAKESDRSIAATLPKLQNMLMENRKKRNQQNGYWIFDPSGAGIAHGKRIVIPRKDVHSLALMSDGFYEITQLDAAPTHPQLISLLETTPAEELVRSLFSALEADPLFDRYPRFKLKDDATVVYARVE